MTLQECLAKASISFDLPVIVTELIQDFQMTWQEVEQTLSDFIAAEEQNGKVFEKRFLIQGEEVKDPNDTDNITQVYMVVDGERSRKEWLSKLKLAESFLYEVRLAGSAPSPPRDYKPVRWSASFLPSPEKRSSLRAAPRNGVAHDTTNANGAATSTHESKTDVKSVEEKKATGTLAAAFANAAQKVDSKKSPAEQMDSKKSTPKPTQATPEAKKEIQKQKKGINNFFTTGASTKAKVEKSEPKKVGDMFKKQAVRNQLKKEPATPAANTSVDLFINNDDSAEPSDASSDDEQLKRDEIAYHRLKTSCKVEIESEEEQDAGTSSSSVAAKRRRILDSDDEEPEQKHDKKVKEEPLQEQEIQKEEASSPKAAEPDTYLDEDGFVITIKSKQKNQSNAKPKVKPPLTTSPPSKVEKKSAPTTKIVAKTKQGSITSFFSKK